MRPHPRIRKTVKWGGAAVTVLLAVVWIGSGWWCAGYWARGWLVAAYEGQVSWHTTKRPELGWWTSGWDTARMNRRAEWHWWFEVRKLQSHEMYSVPLWVPGSLALLITAIACWLDLRARRRARRNVCPKCHYDRTGLAAGAVCPECGSAPASSPA